MVKTSNLDDHNHDVFKCKEFSWLYQNAKSCWDGPDKMPTKNRDGQNANDNKKSSKNANLWLAFCPVGIFSAHRQNSSVSTKFAKKKSKDDQRSIVLQQLLPCPLCARTFFPDRLEVRTFLTNLASFIVCHPPQFALLFWIWIALCWV